MRRVGSACLVLAAALGPPAAIGHGHGGGSAGHGHAMGPHVGAPGPHHFNGGVVGQRGPDHRGRGGGHFASSGGHFISGGPGVGWWVVGGAWIPLYAAPVDAAPQVAYYCQSLGAWFPAVQACPEDWLVVVPAPQ